MTPTPGIYEGMIKQPLHLIREQIRVLPTLTTEEVQFLFTVITGRIERKHTPVRSLKMALRKAIEAWE